MRNYKFRLYPTFQQESKLVNALQTCNWVYNRLIQLKPYSRNELNYALTELKETEPWLYNYHSKMLQMISTRITAEHNSLKALRKKGCKVGSFASIERASYNSFTYNQSGFKIEKRGKTDLLWLSKIGCTEIRLHRKLADIKQVTVFRRNEKWYAIITCDIAKSTFCFIDPRKSVGIDLGITKFAHDSNNRIVDNPLFLTSMAKPLRRAQRQLSRREKGGHNYQKAKSRVARLHERIRNKRQDFLHKESYHYSKEYDLIFVERLHTCNLARNRHTAKRILDSGWSTFRQFLAYKGKMVMEIDPYNTTVDCSQCGNKVQKDLAVRIHCCDRCGLVIDRDYNASLNILQKGLLQLPQGLREVTPVEILCGSMKQEMLTGCDGKYPHVII
nr:RNA-guided endonuclease TnpB family protein [Candidatus Nitrososphaera evergladensis]